MSPRIWLALAATVATTHVSAQQPAPPAPAFAAPNLTEAGVRAMAANCTICHGALGKPAPGSALPPLAGRASEVLAGALRDFKTGKREATVMHQIAKGYGDAEIDALAAYFARQR
jgi:cytochrome c553